MQRLHHRLEFAFRARGGRVVLMRGEVPDRVVAPEVAQTLLDEMPVLHEVVHRHQLHRRNAETFQIVDDRRGRESRIGAAILRRHIGMLHREAAHVHLVDDRVVPRRAGMLVIAPGECGIDHLALRHAERVIAPVERQIAPRTADAIAEVRVRPRQLTDDRLRVRIEQELVRVEAVSLLRLIGSVHAISIQFSGARFGQIAMPHLISLFAQPHALQLAAAAAVEQAQLDALSVFGKQREIDALAVPGGALRIGSARPDCGDVVGHRKSDWR